MSRLHVLVLMVGLSITACGSTSQAECNSRTCQGCCTDDGKCEAGNTAGACGSIGGTCRDCSGLGLSCTLGSCSALQSGSGGGGGGGGSGGGTGGGGGVSMACAVNNGGCAAEALCTSQGATRVCTCNTGYVGDGFTCSDVNECNTANGGCSTNATCSNSVGGRTCTCVTGYTGDGVSCTDLNECLTNNGGCSTNAACNNNVGGRTCSCVSGYAGNGVTCTDVNECLTNNGGCSVNADCTNSPGSSSCACWAGFSGDGFTCTAAVATWAFETVSFQGGSTSSLAFDATGNPAIAYTSDSPRGVHFRRRLGTNSWSSAEIVDASTNAMAPVLTLSTLFVIANSVLNLNSSMGASWRRATASSWPAGNTLSGPEQPDLAVGGVREHLVANSRIAGMPSTLSYFSRSMGLTTTWSPPTTISSTASWSAAKVAASPNGQLAVLYTRNSDNALMLARSSGMGTSWTSTLVSSGIVATFDLAVADSGLASIAYYTTTGHLIRFERWLGSTRQSQVTVDSPGGTAPGSQYFSGVSVAVDSSGNAHLSYLDFTRPGYVLRYATDRSGSFVAETVGLCDDVLENTSIAVDSANAPHISYPLASSSFGSLGYAVKR